ncbi:MAG TPA: DMT family transporter [Paenalcaligenes hominis]|uniref:DMT family transporter n=1 Tax=Paenalcaligenes hominis TaxID=643674 RepID=A0A9D2VGJ2_9BURK|nr:DMT family transporter [Paenalcaligenes hominis]NJB66002.1 drug/metabolite transporter (DMT)-like permease [Paenalcaligenes hominis]GGE71329.1 multidrug DMT transporter permease [Paenalcaligenes hominis]HJH24054.1 DMT family transporter [Paenalcaligenes hominis]
MSSTRRTFWIGFLLAGLGSILFSAKAIVAKLTYMHGVDALTVIGFRMLLALPAFLTIAVWQAYKAYRGQQVALSTKQRWQVVVLGFIGYYLASLLDFLGLQYITAGLERLILFLAPTFVLLFSALFLKKLILPKQWVALAISYLGVSLVFVQDLSLEGDHVLLGAGLVLGSALSYSFYLIGSGELLKQIGSTRLVAYAMVTSAIYTLIHFFIVQGWAGLDQPKEVYGLSLIHATLNTVFPTFMIMWAVERVGAPMTAQLGLIGPVSILFLAYWFLDEPITLMQIGGTVLVLTGAMVLSRKK